MLTAVDVKLISLVHLYQEVLGDKGLQIYSKCDTLRQYFAVKRVKCSIDCSGILV